MRECPERKRQQQARSVAPWLSKQELPPQPSKKVGMMKQDGEKLILCPSVVGRKALMAALDTGAEVNMISTKAAEGMKGERFRKRSSLESVGSDVDVKEGIRVEIEIGKTKTVIEADITDKVPCDVLLGGPFLMEHSKGYEIMKKSCIG